MTEVREVTHVRRMRTLKVYTLESSVTAVPCLSGGVAKDASFKVSLYLSENNKDRTPYKAKIRYKRCNGQSCESFVTSSVAFDAVSVDTGKNAGKVFDRYFIEAFEQKGKEEKVLATLQVPTVVDGQQGEAGSAGPLLVPYGSWDAKRTYRSTSDVKIFVERKKMYYVLVKLNTDCVGVDPATDVKNEYWRLMDYVEYMFVNAMVADFGKIGSAVFSGDYMLSQYGVDKGGHPIQTDNGYEAFTPDMSNFTPNILLNFLTGYAHFAKKNVVFKENGDVEIKGYIREGRIGSFKLDMGITNITGEDTDGGSIYNPGAFIKLLCEKVSNDTRFSVNETGTIGVCDIYIGEKSAGGTGLRIFSYGQKSKCIHVTSNGGGVENRAIESHGNVDLHARGGEKIKLMADNGGMVSVAGLHLAVQTCNGPAKIGTNVDFIRTNADGRYTIQLPDPTGCTGKVYYYKNTSGTWDLTGGYFVWGNEWQQHTTITISSTQALQLISDGVQWCIFRGW